MSNERINVTSWQDCNTLTKLCHDLISEMMSYQAYSLQKGKGHFGGDQGVMVAAITLRKRLKDLIEKSPH